MRRIPSGRLAGGSIPLRGVATIIVIGAAATVTACQSSEQTEAGAEASGEVSAIHEPPESEAHAAATMEVGYTCADDKTFSIAFAGQDQIHITFDGETQILSRTAGHTGLLFTNDDIVFFSRGAMLRWKSAACRPSSTAWPRDIRSSP